MKRILLFTLIFSFSLGIALSQTESEKRAILKTIDQSANNSLREEIQSTIAQRNSRIDAYLAAHPDMSREIEINGKTHQMIDVINNKPLYQTTDNVDSAIATRTNFLHNGGGLGLNIEGQNMLVGVWDENHALVTHQEFRGTGFLDPARVETPDYIPFNSTYDFHATHVSGTIIGKGTNPDAKGMAPQANLISFDWDDDSIEVLDEVSTNALLISNHSYGVPVQNAVNAGASWLMGCYNTDALQWDNIHYNNPYYLQVVSAGNDGQQTYFGGLASGYDKLTTEKNSKNNLVVANANNPSVNSSGELLSLNINSNSSQGPTDDGRIKPDIAGDGTAVFSAISTNDQAYGIASGTSMSSPNVAGTLILLQQYYNSLNSQYMKSATLKGLVCHTADDDSQKAGPDPIFGWGLLNAKAAAETILDATSGQAIISELTLQDQDTYTTTFTTSGSGPVSATICWTDPAGTNQSGINNSPIPALVNDLDLRLTAPDGSTVFFPWKLSLFNIAAPATTGDNLVDTVEKIDILTPTAGTYTLTVTHKGTLTNAAQDFSLIVTGSDITLSTNESELSNFLIWPNPANDILNYQFSSENGSNVQIALYDLQGRAVYSEFVDGNNYLIQGNINTSNYAKGIYLLKIKQGNAQVNKRVIIK